MEAAGRPQIVKGFKICDFIINKTKNDMEKGLRLNTISDERNCVNKCTSGGELNFS